MTRGTIVENSAKAVIVDERKVLLMHYHDRKMGIGTWYSLPGGRQEFGETLTEALIRECTEEIGTVVSPERLLFVREYIHSRHHLAGRGRDQHKVEFYFLCRTHAPVDARYVADGAVADEGQEGLGWHELSALHELRIFPTGLRDLERMLGNGPGEVYWGDTF